jgi:hypothetical protein
VLAQRGPFRRTQGGFANAATQAETTSWQAQVVTNGGAVSAARFTIVNNFIAAEKAAGTWALTDDYWGLWAEDTIGALTSLKQLRMGGSFAAPSFVPSQGYTFDGATNYVNTLFVPSTHTLVMTASNMRLAIYERTNVSGANVAAGAVNVAGLQPGIWLGCRTGALTLSRPNVGTNIQFTLPVSDSRGYTTCSLNGTLLTNINNYKNGAALVYSSGSPTFQATLPTTSLYIGGANLNNVLNVPRPASVGLVAIGATLSAAQEQAQYNNVQAWATAIGAAV